MPLIRNDIRRGLYQKSVRSEILHNQELQQYEPISDEYPRALSLLSKPSARYSNSKYTSKYVPEIRRGPTSLQLLSSTIIIQNPNSHPPSNIIKLLECPYNYKQPEFRKHPGISSSPVLKATNSLRWTKWRSEETGTTSKNSNTMMSFIRPFVNWMRNRLRKIFGKLPKLFKCDE
jgi:hypothetical protein